MARVMVLGGVALLFDILAANMPLRGAVAAGMFREGLVVAPAATLDQYRQAVHRRMADMAQEGMAVYLVTLELLVHQGQ